MEIQLDKLRKVEFTMRAFRAFNEETGKSLLTGGIGNMDDSVMLEMVYAGLIGAKEDFGKMSKQEIKDLVCDHFTLKIFEQVVKAYENGVRVLNGEKVDEKK